MKIVSSDCFLAPHIGARNDETQGPHQQVQSQKASLPNERTLVTRIKCRRIRIPHMPQTSIGSDFRTKLTQRLAKEQRNSTKDKLAFLDKGLKGSPFESKLSTFPASLQTVPDFQNSDSLGETVLLKNGRLVRFQAFPQLGIRPSIDETALDFLDKSVTEACVCTLSHLPNSGIRANWTGRNALRNVQCWSATKFIQMLWAVSRAHQVDISTDVDRCVIDTGGRSSISFHQFMVDIVSYRGGVADSNSKAGTLKQLTNGAELTSFIERITGTTDHSFDGLYHNNPLSTKPKLIDSTTRKVLIAGPGASLAGDNKVSMYALTRLMTMLAWHHHLPASTRIPNAQWSSLESVVRALGTDSARYIDVAMKELGIFGRSRAQVAISKLGFGFSDSRGRLENVLVGALQYEDLETRASTGRSTYRSLCFALRLGRGDGSLQAHKDVDTQMAVEVTDLLRSFEDRDFA